MNFPTAIVSGLSQYARWKGRASRSEYWYFSLFRKLAFLGAALTTYALNNGVPLLLAFLALFLPGIAVQIRRLHDTGRSGAWFWIHLVPLIGWIVLVCYSCAAGDGATNYYGPPPAGQRQPT